MRTINHRIDSDIREFIQVGNVLQLWSKDGLPERTLPSFAEFHNEFWRRRREEWEKIKRVFAGDRLALSLEARRTSLNEILSAFPSNLRTYISATKDDDELTEVDLLRYTHNSLINYEELCVRVGVVQKIIERPRSVHSILLPGIQKINIPRKGLVQQTLVEDLLLKKIEVERIRSCEFCLVVFWAERTDAVYCSAKCGKAFRQQKWRNSKKTLES